jgi:glycosyltransferase involved in cell wall biosynthesis
MPWKSKKVIGTLRFCLWSSAKFSQAIITCSQNSKADLVNTYGVPESKISVISHGYDKDIFNSAIPDPALVKILLEGLGIHRPYLLHHGAIKPNKNLKRLIQAYRLLLERNRNLDFDLVLAGTLGWEYEEVLKAANDNAGSRGNVVLTGALSDADLVLLIKGATLAVIPSLYEGFCIPMVECMACGIPTIAANSSCLPEISGGVLRYFDPQSVEAIAACMQEVLEDDSLRKELIEKGRLRANAFGWRRCAKETLALLAQLARNDQ